MNFSPENIASFEKDRVKSMTLFLITLIFALAFLVGGLLLFMTPNYEIIGFVLFGLSVIFFLLCGVVSSLFKKNMAKNLGVKILKTTYPDSVFEPNHKMIYEEFNEPMFFSTPDRYDGGNFVKTNIDGVDFFMSDYTLLKRQTDSKGHTSYAQYAKGKMFEFVFDRNLNHTVKIIEKAFFGNNVSRIQNLQKIETESVPFNKKFNIYTSNDQFAFYVLTPQIQEVLLKIEPLYGGQIFFSFQSNKLFVAANDNESSFNISLFKKIDRDLINRQIEKISFPIKIINELNLSSDKFNDESLNNV